MQSIGFKIFAKILPAETRDKVFVFGTDYIKHLTKYIDIDMIPPQYNGTGKWKPRLTDVPKEFPFQTDDEYL